MFKYPKVFQRDNGPEFKKEVTKLPEKHSSDIRRATTKYKDTHTAFVQASHKELVKQLFKLMGAEELQDPENVSKFWVKSLYRIVNNEQKMNNTKLLMID